MQSGGIMGESQILVRVGGAQGDDNKMTGLLLRDQSSRNPYILEMYLLDSLSFVVKD